MASGNLILYCLFKSMVRRLIDWFKSTIIQLLRKSSIIGISLSSNSWYPSNSNSVMKEMYTSRPESNSAMVSSPFRRYTERCSCQLINYFHSSRRAFWISKGDFFSLITPQYFCASNLLWWGIFPSCLWILALSEDLLMIMVMAKIFLKVRTLLKRWNGLADSNQTIHSFNGIERFGYTPCDEEAWTL